MKVLREKALENLVFFMIKRNSKIILKQNFLKGLYEFLKFNLCYYNILKIENILPF